MKDFKSPERKKRIPYIERHEFERILIEEGMDDIVPDPITDGWDVTPRPEVIDPSNSLPLGHIALQGDFEHPESDQ